MSQTRPARIRFRSVRDRTLEDQAVAVGEGYNSVLELFCDEMLQGLVELQTRVDELEQGNRQSYEVKGTNVGRGLFIEGGDPED